MIIFFFLHAATILLSISFLVNGGSFTDNHGDGSLTGWTTVGARGWSESGGVALSDHDDLKRGSFLINDYSCANDGTFYVKLNGNGDQNSLDGGVIFRYIDSTHYYCLQIVEACANCQSADNKLLLKKNTHTKTSSTYATIQSNLNFSSTSEVYTIKVRAVGSTFTFWVSGGSESSYTDASSPHLTGKAGYVYSGEPDRYMTFDSCGWVDTNITADYTWDISTTSGTQTGNGTWGSSSYWTATGGAGTSLVTWPGAGYSATFAGSDGTYAITVSGTQNVDSLTFSNSGYTLSGGTAVNLGTKTGIYVASGKSATISTPITTTGGLTLKGGGTLILSGTNTYTSATTISAGTLQIGAGSTAGAISNSSSITDNSALIFNRSDAYTYSGVISGTGTVTKSGAGTTTLSGTNTYTGITTISAGTLQIGAGSTAGAISNSSNITNNSSLSFNRSDAYAYSGVISGTGTMTKSGAGTLTLTGNNTFTGATTISTGTIQIGNNGTSGAMAGNISNGSGCSVLFYRSDALTYSGVISGTGTITKSGAGALTLSGVNTYTGTTTISVGSVLVTGSTASGSAVTVASGATLGGTGTVSGTVAANGAISPGTSGIGKLTTGSSLTFTGTGSFIGTISGTTTAGTDYDQVSMSAGTLTLASAALSLTLTYAPTAGHTYTIINNAGSSAVSGIFNGYAEGATIALLYNGNKYLFTISYTGGTGNDVVLTCQGVAPTDDYTDWAYSQTIILNTTVTGANVLTNVYDFPVLVRLDPGTFSFFSQTRAGGSDIRFAKTNGAHLSYSIELWKDYDNDQDTAVIWVKVDTVYGNNKTQSFVMYWGKSDAADSSNGGAVFDTGNGFVGVWHLNENPESGVAPFIDRTSNHNDGRDTSGLDATDLVTGIIGNDINFDSTNTEFIKIPHSSSLAITGDLTISAWVKLGSTNSGGYYGIGGKMSQNGSTFYGYNLSRYTDNCFRFGIGDGTSSYKYVASDASYSGTDYKYIAGVVRSNQIMYLYVDGVEQSSTVGSTIPADGGDFAFIGRMWSTLNERYFKGDIDEFIISNTGRSADWIRLCYENQKASQSLVNLEDYATWGFSRVIKVNTCGVTTTNCIAFPLLVRLTSTTFDFNQARDSGQDIRFSKSSGVRLPYQIERWSKNGTVAEIWVRLDTVYANDSSQYIRMYWGKDGVTSRSNATNVFGTANHFSGTWHLDEEGNTTAYDATANDNDASTSTFTTASDVTGAIGIAREFDGTDDYLQVNNNLLADLLSGGNKKTTISFWVKADATAANRFIIWEGNGSANGWGSHEELHAGFGRTLSGVSADNYLSLYFGDTDDYSSSGNPVTTYTAYSDVTNWHYASMTLDNTSGAETGVMYLDGTSINTSVGNIAASFSTWNTNTRFGRPGTADRYFDGKLDEVAIADTTRSADWIKLCYETQKPAPTIVTCDSADAFRPLGIRRYQGTALDSVYVGNARWALRFAKNKGGGIKFLAKDTSGTNQIDANLFTVIYNGHSSDTGTGTLTVNDSSIVFARVRQQKSIAGQPFYIDYSVLGSGRVYVQVGTDAATTLSGGLEFRIANTSTSYSNVKYGSTAATCRGVLHADLGSGKYDLLMAPYELWTAATDVTAGSTYSGIRSSSWSSIAGKQYRWRFMIDFSHQNLSDSAAAYRYLADYRTSDTLGFYAGTPLLEEAWESDMKGFWTFDEGTGATTIADKSGQGHNATLYGSGASWTEGTWLSAALDLGGSDSITVAHHSDFDRHMYQTVMAWIKPQTTFTGATILKKYSSANSGYKLIGGSGGTVLYSVGNGGSTVELQSATALSAGTWYHVAAKVNLFTDQNYIKLFINGNLDTMRRGEVYSYFGNNSDAVVIGKGFDGVVDDVRIYNRLLTDEEVKAIALKGFSPELGMYSVRADNNNTLHCRMHGNPNSRFLPALQITNWWATTLPTYVYVDGVQLTSGTDYYGVLDDNRNWIALGLNRVLSGTTSIFIDDNNSDGYLKTGPTRKMYWGREGTDNQYFWVKNTAGSYFGSAAANEFYLNWKMSPSDGKDGELWQMRSSVTNPNTLIDTSTGTNLVPGNDGYKTGFGAYSIIVSGHELRSTDSVSNAFTYAVEESSQVRIRLRINERQLLSTASLRMVTRWTIYPNGQLFRYDSIYQMSAAPTKVYATIDIDDQTYVSFSKNEAKKRAIIINSQTYPDVVGAWLSLKNSSGYQAEPFEKDTVNTHQDAQRAGFDFNQYTSSPAQWSSGVQPVQAIYYLDLHHAAMNSSSMDSISNGVQNIGLNGGAALAMVNGTLVTGSAGDLNSDGFNEQEGAYVINTTDNTVKFKLPARNDTCRYYPAFRITGYTAVQRPQYVFLYSGSSSKALLEGYQFNSYVSQTAHELIVQIDSIFCDSVGIYISSDKTLAVKMSTFEARGGNGCDTLLWRTESEHENLGYRIERRIQPEFFDSVMLDYAEKDSAGSESDSNAGVNRLIKRRLIKYADTNWLPITTKLIAGAPSGTSLGPRNYRYTDKDVYNNLCYEYRLIAVDYHQQEEMHGPVSAIPRHIAPGSFMLGCNYPNPFRHSTCIRFALPEEAAVSLKIYNLQGRLVRTLLSPDRKLSADYHQVLWDGNNDSGVRTAAGQYVYQITTGRFLKARLMLLLR